MDLLPLLAAALCLLAGTHAASDNSTSPNNSTSAYPIFPDRHEKYILAPRPSHIDSAPAPAAPASNTSVDTNGTASLSRTTGTDKTFTRDPKYILGPVPSSDDFLASNEGAQTEASPAGLSSFVRTSGQYFTVDGQVRYFAGSNDYFLILR